MIIPSEVDSAIPLYQKGAPMIIAHSYNTTINNFLSMVLISYATKDTVISHIDFDDAKAAIEDPTQACIALGNSDFSTNASPITTAKYFGINLPEDSLWQYLDDVGTKGPEQAYKLNDVPLFLTERIRDAIGLMLKTWDLVLAKGTVDTKLFIEIGNYLSKQNFTLKVLHLEVINSIVQDAYPNEFKKVLDQLAQEKQKGMANEVLFEDDRVLITVQDAMVADIPRELLTDRTYYKGDGMDILPIVLVLNKVTGKVVECPLGRY